MPPKLIEKLDGLQKKFERADPWDKEQLNGWYRDAKKLMLIQHLAGHDAIKFLLERFESAVQQINDQLLGKNSLQLPDYERDLLLIKREFYEEFIRFFRGSENDVEKLEQEVEKELAH